MRWYVVCALMLGVVVGFASFSFADKRSYVWTYEYQTMPQGMWELEYYVTGSIPRLADSGINTIGQQVELEYGISNRWDVSLYQLYTIRNRRAETDSGYDGFKVRTRYRFAEKGRWLVDPLLYLEYKRDPHVSDPQDIEAKIVLAKDIGDFNVSYNQVFERELERRGKTQLKYATGISYHLTSAVAVGIESKGSYSDPTAALGPTLSWSGKTMWAAAGTAWGLGRGSDDMQARLIVGVLL